MERDKPQRSKKEWKQGIICYRERWREGGREREREREYVCVWGGGEREIENRAMKKSRVGTKKHN